MKWARERRRGGGWVAGRLDVDACPGAALYVSDPAVPRRETSITRVAARCHFLRSDDRTRERGRLAFRTLSGHQQQPQLASVISTLAIAALFNPWRRHIQSFIERHFYRGKYDAAKTLEDFGSRLGENTDLDSLSGALVRVVRKTLQPEQVTLLMRQPGRTVASEESRP